MCKALAISASNCSPLVLKNKRMFAFMRGIPAGGFRWAAQFALLRASGQAKPRPSAEIPYGCAANPLINGWLYTLAGACPRCLRRAPSVVAVVLQSVHAPAAGRVDS